MKKTKRRWRRRWMIRRKKMSECRRWGRRIKRRKEGCGGGVEGV